MPIQIVALTPEETTLFDGIFWDIDELLRREHGEKLQSFENAKELTESLLQRDAIPQIRLAYFFDAEKNIGGYGKSREQVFRQSGASSADIKRHPGFLPHLWYFIHGPQLPAQTIEGLCRIIEEDSGTSGMVLNQVQAYVRKEVRDRGLDHHAPDEFMKLAFELDRPHLAEVARSAAKTAKRR